MAEEKTNGWKIAFWIFCSLWIIQWVVIFIAAHQPQQATTQDSTATTSNQQNLQQCIQNAQDLFNAGAGITPGAADGLNASVNACKAEYPTN